MQWVCCFEQSLFVKIALLFVCWYYDWTVKRVLACILSRKAGNEILPQIQVPQFIVGVSDYISPFVLISS